MCLTTDGNVQLYLERNLTIPIELTYKPQYSAIPLLNMFNVENPTQIHNESYVRRIISAHILSK